MKTGWKIRIYESINESGCDIEWTWSGLPPGLSDQGIQAVAEGLVAEMNAGADPLARHWSLLDITATEARELTLT